MVWSYTTGGPIKITPIVLSQVFTGSGADYVYFASDDGYVYAINAATGVMRTGWPVLMGAPVRSGPTWDCSTLTITVGSMDGKTMRIVAGSANVYCP